MVRVYLLYAWSPYDGFENLGVYSSLENAEKQRELATSKVNHERISIDDFVLDAPFATDDESN